jgi:phage regulator Rha-like protein
VQIQTKRRGGTVSDLVFIQNGVVLTDSLTVADMFGKEHKNVKRDIENVIGKIDELKTTRKQKDLVSILIRSNLSALTTSTLRTGHKRNTC